MRAPQYLFPAGARFGADNLVLHARARKHSVEGFGGPFSIKTVIDGEVTWKLGRRDVTVDARSFLVLRQGEPYSLHIDSHVPVETCCVFFQAGFAEQVFQDATTPIEASLDNPDRKTPELPFASHLHPDAEGRLLLHVQQLARRCEGQLCPSASEEAFLEAAGILLFFHREVKRQIVRLPAVKPATREELFRRLLIARDYMHASVDERLSLDRIARAACLSRYHLHRTFSAAFHSTPHQYLTSLRLARACDLLANGAPVEKAQLKAGFTSASSFTRLFRGRYGLPPSKFAKSDKNGAASAA